MLKKVYFILLTVILIASCVETPGEGTSMLTDNFDRKEMLEFWAEEIILPAFSNYQDYLTSLSDQATVFYSDPSLNSLESFRSSWLEAYLAWQEVSMFEIGKAEEIGLRNFTNIYPADPELIFDNINSGNNFNLDLPSNFPAQGFPALDYLLFGSADTDLNIIDVINTPETMEYVVTLIDRLNTLTSEVQSDWELSFKDEFINNSGSSGTASTDKMVNDFLFYYEKFLRAAKVGMPAGVFSGNIETNLVEGKYSGVYSKQLLQRGFSSVQDFFNGVSFDGQATGNSLSQYLTDIHISNNTDFDFSESINVQWDVATESISDLQDNFQNQIIEDNNKMLTVYDELNKAVRILKVDMMQALNIQVDFVDADGD